VIVAQTDEIAIEKSREVNACISIG
jgi:hypothetical protein